MGRGREEISKMRGERSKNLKEGRKKTIQRNDVEFQGWRKKEEIFTNIADRLKEIITW